MSTMDVQEICTRLEHLTDQLNGLRIQLAPWDFRDHEERIRALERMVWKAIGAGCAVGGATGSIFSLLFGG